jgi:soluble lytic murein transglycosylase-like protein
MKQTPSRALFYVAVTSAILLASVSDSDAEVLFFTNGRTMSVKDYRLAGDLVTVTLRQGGEATFKRSLIARIGPDEVPATESAAASPATDASMPASRKPVGSRPFAALIESVSVRHGVDPALVHAVIEAESNYRSTAKSQVGARGLMQVMPATARDLGVTSSRLLFDPAHNVEAGVKYLKFLFDRFEGDLPTVLAAYNAGPGAVDKYSGIPPYPETQNYVRRVLSNLQQ